MALTIAAQNHDGSNQAEEERPPPFVHQEKFISISYALEMLFITHFFKKTSGKTGFQCLTFFFALTFDDASLSVIVFSRKKTRLCLLPGKTFCVNTFFLVFPSDYYLLYATVKPWLLKFSEIHILYTKSRIKGQLNSESSKHESNK